MRPTSLRMSLLYPSYNPMEKLTLFPVPRSKLSVKDTFGGGCSDLVFLLGSASDSPLHVEALSLAGSLERLRRRLRKLPLP